MGGLQTVTNFPPCLQSLSTGEEGACERRGRRSPRCRAPWHPRRSRTPRSAACAPRRATSTPRHRDAGHPASLSPLACAVVWWWFGFFPFPSSLFFFSFHLSAFQITLLIQSRTSAFTTHRVCLHCFLRGDAYPHVVTTCLSRHGAERQGLLMV